MFSASEIYKFNIFLIRKLPFKCGEGGTVKEGVSIVHVHVKLYTSIFFFKMHFSIKSIACELIKINLILGTACSCSACTDTSTCALQFA